MKPQTIRVTKKELDAWYRKFSGSKTATDDFISKDPVQFPLRYAAHANRHAEQQADVEIAAFLAATIAWGRRDLIIRSAQKMFAMMEPGPAAFVMSGSYRKLKDRGSPLERCVHRTFFEGDLKYFCKGFKACYEKHGSLEKLFAGAPDVWQGISLFRKEMAAGNKGSYSKHLANPDANSACKRINLALRWLVRKGPVDLGLWTGIQASALYIPLDVHVARNARKLGLLERKSNDRKAVTELTERLRDFCPEDPVKYDFALFDDDI
ncbi:MAG: TIGR02757 family protein [Treponema sp.]|nr:TIGR02757 family protein [Treponema sp.]